MAKKQKDSISFSQELAECKNNYIEKMKADHENATQSALLTLKHTLRHIAGRGANSATIKNLYDRTKSVYSRIDQKDIEDYIVNVLRMKIHKDKGRPGIESDYIQW
jgi:hypothetical protein